MLTKTGRTIPHSAVAVISRFVLAALLVAGLARADNGVGDPASAEVNSLIFSSVATHRFVASHGQRAVLMGYPQSGLEFLAYPLQIISGYQIGFRVEGSVSETDARLLLSRVEATPDHVMRIYTGPDYVVRETLFVPLDQPAAILRYEVESVHPLDIIVHFAPVLDLMWPAAMGGQSTRWNADASAYVITEPAHGFNAWIGSPQANAHDGTVNSTLHDDGKLAFSIRAAADKQHVPNDAAVATVFIAQLAANQPDPAVAMRTLAADADKFRAQADAHYRDLQRESLRIRTPDRAFDDALAWAQVALDQAWVCNPELGCGLVAGYGPSRPGRRPQYAWFFGGDGLLTTEALISSDAFARAREELEFIVRYQDETSGMIWHELAQSANYVDWRKQPHMFVHVDISFAYLTTVARYVQASGDIDFAIKHWDSIAGAYRYCQTLIDPHDNLPHIPADKSAGDEQHSPADDLGLSTSWVDATQSFAALAQVTGHGSLSAQAMQESALARARIPKKYWDDKRGFWVGSHTAKGEPIYSRGSGPGSAIGANLFSPEQTGQLLGQIASSKFQTDWGTRGIGGDSSIYAPWSYATGSIFAVHSTQSAQMFWAAHRPEIAWSIFRGTVPWSTLDAPGHIHEVMAGNFYRAQTESVPEQTWSSAGLLDAALRGLFGIEVHAAQNEIVLKPHMPAEWNEMSVDDIRLPHSKLGFTLRHDAGNVELDLRNAGESAAIDFSPEIPLGAQVIDAQCDGVKLPVTVTTFAQDSHARMKLAVANGTSHCHLRLSGGVSVLVPAQAAQIGDGSVGVKLTQLQLQGHRLALDADVHARGADHFQLQTPWKIQAIAGASLKVIANDLYDVQFAHAVKSTGPKLSGSSSTMPDGYSSTHVEITFENP